MAELLNQHWIVLVVLGVVALVVLVSLALRGQPLPYEKRKSLLTSSELAFYRVLADAAGGDWAICAMVRMADLIKVRANTRKEQAWRNRILAKHIDFLLCDCKTMEARLAVELDDKSHARADRQRRDRFVDAALDAADLPLLRVPVQSSYSASELRAHIAAKLNDRKTGSRS